MSIGFPKRSKQSRKRARQKAERDAWRGPAHDLPPLRESRRAQPTDTSELRREDNMSCSTCHFAKPTTEIDGALVCRRYPPVPLPGYGFGQWPVVRHTSWCGEWAVRS